MTDLVCIVCPRSCTMKVSCHDGDITVTGNHCKRGFQFAIDEMTAPKRTICSTVRTVFPQASVLPVRVSKEIPKERIFDVMKELAGIIVDKPLDKGDIVVENILSLGVDIIATSNILMDKNME